MPGFPSETVPRCRLFRHVLSCLSFCLSVLSAAFDVWCLFPRRIPTVCIRQVKSGKEKKNIKDLSGRWSMIGSIYLFLYLSQNSRFLLTFFFLSFCLFSFLHYSPVCACDLGSHLSFSHYRSASRYAPRYDRTLWIRSRNSTGACSRWIFWLRFFFLVLCFFINLSFCHYHQERKSLK